MWEIDPTIEESPEERPTVKESLREIIDTLDLFMNNKFEEAFDKVEPCNVIQRINDQILNKIPSILCRINLYLIGARCSPYHALGKSFITMIQVLLSFDPDDINKAVKILKESVAVCHRQRKKGTILYITKLLRGVDYNLYTDEEAHAELCYAECLLLNVLLTFVSDSSFVNFIKGGFRIRTCYRTYKEAENILLNRRWESEEERKHFESGVRMGLGMFYLVVSHLPTRVIRVLEMIGFCGDREMGLRNLYESVALDGSLRSPITALIIGCYNTIITYLFGLSDGDLVSTEYVLKKMLKLYPRGALYLFLYGRLLGVRGEVDESINLLLDSLTVQDKWRQMRNLGSWEIMWCYSIKFEWRKAEKYLDYLRRESRWSPAIYTYTYALCLYMRVLEEGRTDLMEEIVDLMKKVPSLKQKLAGKSFPLEKFVVAKAKKFIAQNNRLLLPFIELMYICNNFTMYRNNSEVMNRLLEAVEKEMPEMDPQTEMDTEQAEDYCLAVLLKAMCLKTLGQTEESKSYLHEIFRYEDYLGDDIYLVTHAMAELGYMALQEGDYEESLKWLDKACNDYTNYHLESFLHYRIHAAIRHIQIATEGSSSASATPSPLTSPEIYSNDTKANIFSYNLPPTSYEKERNGCSAHVYSESPSVVS